MNKLRNSIVEKINAELEERGIGEVQRALRTYPIRKAYVGERLGKCEKEVLDLSETLGEIDLSVSEVETKIGDIEITVAEEIFGENAKQPERTVLVLSLEDEEDARITLNVPKGLTVEQSEDGIEYIVENKTAVMRSINNQMSKFGKYFRAHNDKGPQVGDEITVKLDSKGYFQLAY